MAFTTKDVRPIFECDFGATRKFVVKGDVAFAILDSGEPVLGFVNFYGGRIRVESFVTRNSTPVPLSVVPPQWFANAARKFIRYMGTRAQQDWWRTLTAVSKALSGNCGTIDLDPQHPFAQGTRIVHFVVGGPNRADAFDADGKLIASYTKAGVVQALTSQPGPIISWS
jgi:hypothetical protein